MLSETSKSMRDSVCRFDRSEPVSEIFRGKWSLTILYAIQRKPVRLGELTRLIPNASKKVLIDNLKRLEAAGIVVRNNRSRRVLHVEYDFPEDLKQAMSRLLDCLAVWSEAYAKNAETCCEWSTSKH